MISLSWHTIRARRSSLVGSFIALALGVGLLAGMALTLASTIGGGGGGPVWYAHPQVVVSGVDTVSVTTGSGEERETESLRASEPRLLPADLVTRLSTVDATTVVDHATPAVADGAPGDTVHPWSASTLHPFGWVAGGPPAAATDVVLAEPTRYRPGDEVTVHSVRGAERFRVSGVLRSSAPPALYTTDAVAAALAGGRARAVAFTVPAGGSGSALVQRVRDAVGGDRDVRVLTGDARRRAEPDPDGEKREVAISLLATTCGLAGFVSIFVVAGTFGYAVAARRREFGLLRTAGATPRQVRRLVLGEALAVGVLASAAGGALGTAVAPPFAEWLARSGFAPDDFTAHFIFWPVAAAFGAGLLVALTVGIAAATLISLGTLFSAVESATRDRITADAVAVPAGSPGIADTTVAALRAAPGVTAAVPATDTQVFVRDGDSPEDWLGRYIHGPDAARVLNLPLDAGSLDDLTGTGTVAVPAGRWRLGETATLWLGDATPVSLRVVAVLARQVDLTDVVLLPWDLRAAHTRPLADIVYLRGAAPSTVDGATVVPAGDFVSVTDREQRDTNRLASIAVLGMALLYTGIAIANTLVMATADRSRELATLRLSGATPRQLVRMVGVEAVLVTCVGVLLAGVVTAVVVAGMRSALDGLAPSVPIDAPWRVLGGITAACLVTAVVASVVPAALLLRRRPVELAGVRE